MRQPTDQAFCPPLQAENTCKNKINITTKVLSPHRTTNLGDIGRQIVGPSRLPPPPWPRRRQHPAHRRQSPPRTDPVYPSRGFPAAPAATHADNHALPYQLRPFDSESHVLSFKSVPFRVVRSLRSSASGPNDYGFLALQHLAPTSKVVVLTAQCLLPYCLK